ncbi:restriction endonuclease fold toxin-2 domain-containing protein [Streptomyces sp. NPDC055709]
MHQTWVTPTPGAPAGNPPQLQARHNAALTDPRNNEIRGFEITNDETAGPYWQSMMAMSGVNGRARYVP